MSLEMEAGAPAEELEPEVLEEGVSGEDEAPAETDEGDGEGQKPKSGFKRRIAELTKARHDTERDRDYWRDLALRNNQPRQESAPQPEPRDALDPANYAGGEYDPEYLIAAAEQKAFQRLQSEQQRQAAVQKRDAFVARVTDADEGAKRLLSDKSFPLSPIMADIVITSDHGVKLADHLGRNPSEAQRISDLPPHLQAFEMARLEQKVTTAPPRLPGAPPPAPSVGSRGAPPQGPRDEMSMADWMRARNQRVRS